MKNLDPMSDDVCWPKSTEQLNKSRGINDFKLSPKLFEDQSCHTYSKYAHDCLHFSTATINTIRILRSQ